MLGQSGLFEMGAPYVQMTSGRGFTPEELATRAVSKIVSVSPMAGPMVQEQAHAFKAQLHAVVLHYLKQAVASEHTTLRNRFIAAGHPELIAILTE